MSNDDKMIWNLFKLVAVVLIMGVFLMVGDL